MFIRSKSLDIPRKSPRKSPRNPPLTKREAAILAGNTCPGAVVYAITGVYSIGIPANPAENALAGRWLTFYSSGSSSPK